VPHNLFLNIFFEEELRLTGRHQKASASAFDGNSAHDYALQTYPKWRNGLVKLSGMVAERILNLVPPYLKFDRRYTTVEKLCNHHAKKLYRQVFPQIAQIGLIGIFSCGF
jgi:hypothetical protein